MVVVVVIVIIHIDRGIGLFVVWCHRKRCFVRIDVLMAVHLVITGQIAVLLVIAQCVGADQGR